MSTAQLEAMAELAEARAQAYLHVAKRLILNEFGPATEHSHTETTIALATAMLQHEGAQIVADAVRASTT